MVEEDPPVPDELKKALDRLLLTKKRGKAQFWKYLNPVVHRDSDGNQSLKLQCIRGCFHHEERPWIDCC